jgi:hypothetical protein
MTSGQLIKLDLDGHELEDNNLLQVPLCQSLLSPKNGTNTAEQDKESEDSCNFDLNHIKEAADDVQAENVLPRVIHVPVSKVKDNILRWKSCKLNRVTLQVPKLTNREVMQSSPRLNTVGFMP